MSTIYARALFVLFYEVKKYPVTQSLLRYSGRPSSSRATPLLVIEVVFGNGYVYCDARAPTPHIASSV